MQRAGLQEDWSSKPGAEGADILEDEEKRLEALDRYDLLDTPGEETFDRIARLAKKIFDVPTAFISLLDGHRQWFKTCEGFASGETPREQAFCNYTIQQERPLIIEDTTRDARFSSNPLVTSEPHVRFYAGAPLRSSDGYGLGTLCIIDTAPRSFGAEQVQILWDLARLATDEFELRLLATKDSLTGALTRRAFKEQAHRAVALALRQHQDLSCLVMDLDHFKAINDTHGHPAGDLVLARTAKACAASLRETDLLGRIGGEEFAVLLPGTTSGGALEVAEKLRSAVESLVFTFGPKPLRVTSSFGAASLGPAGVKELDALLQNADRALYQAKTNGRNRSVLWQGAAGDGLLGARRRTLKAGQILFNSRHSIIDCTVRSLSDHGAGIDVSSTLGVPGSFDLALKAEGRERRCRVLARTDRHLDVAFC
jgi:diguanylate cyclase (GGDEF)-like protein